MKREHRIHQAAPPGVDAVWPLFFWRLCHACRKEFRREWGWRVLVLWYNHNRYTDAFVCAACCPTAQEAGRHFAPKVTQMPRTTFQSHSHQSSHEGTPVVTPREGQG